MSERRQWKRLRSELSLQLSFGAGGAVSAIGTHLNPTGIFVKLADPPSLGTRVRICVSGLGTSGALDAEGEVVDRVVLDDECERPPGVGLCLDHPGPAWSKLYALLTEDEITSA